MIFLKNEKNKKENLVFGTLFEDPIKKKCGERFKFITIFCMKIWILIPKYLFSMK